VRYYRKRRTLVWIAIAILLIVATYPSLRHGVESVPHRIHIAEIRARADAWGLWAPAASVLIMVVQTFIPIPGEFMVAINGAVFGFWKGLAISWIGAIGSACLAFAIGRALSEATTPRTIPQKLLKRADTMIRQGDWTVALMIRFIPLFPFGLFNFAIGRTAVSWTTFLWTTAVGVLPVNAAVVAIGCGIAGAEELLPWGLLALLCLTVLGLVFRYRLAPPRRACGP